MHIILWKLLTDWAYWMHTSFVLGRGFCSPERSSHQCRAIKLWLFTFSSLLLKKPSSWFSPDFPGKTFNKGHLIITANILYCKKLMVPGIIPAHDHNEVWSSKGTWIWKICTFSGWVSHWEGASVSRPTCMYQAKRFDFSVRAIPDLKINTLYCRAYQTNWKTIPTVCRSILNQNYCSYNSFLPPTVGEGRMGKGFINFLWTSKKEEEINVNLLVTFPQFMENIVSTQAGSRLAGKETKHLLPLTHSL